jgi:hypothetical protein
MSGAGPISPVSCTSNSLLAQASHKERQLQRYAVTVLAYFQTCYLTSGRWQDENDVAAQLVGFLQQFLEIFKELKGKKFYLTGESVSTRLLHIESVLTVRQYAGMFVPCELDPRSRFSC